METPEPLHTAGGNEGQPCGNESSSATVISLLGIHPEELKVKIQTGTHKPMFTAALFVRANSERHTISVYQLTKGKKRYTDNNEIL